ncbi:MAG: primary-amine oxidase, partial [Blastocatellia bacterium]
PKPLEFVQKDGTSFKVDGNHVQWQNWDFRFAMQQREGLLLYTAGYNAGGRLRSILYRGSLSEMVVPYGDPSKTWFFKNAFDEGEYSVGRLAQPLQPLVDAPNNAVFFDALFAGDFGTAVSVPRAVALYERDGGILWKHVDYLSTHNESRRARELVLMWVANVGNYEYAFNWVFHQDGTLEMEVDLTGIMQAKGVDPKAVHGSHGHDMYGHKVGDGVEAVHHQHFFNFRLDLDVDGSGDNSVVELNTRTLPRGPSNPYHNAFTTTSTLFHHELEAQRDVSIPASRKWVVISNSARNGLGEPTGYMLVPGENAVPYALPEASVRKRAGFVSHHLWVTKYAPGEMNAAGFYVNQSKGGDGLTKWTRANRSIDDQDVVLWYTMGITHIPRPEEWPVMTVHKAGFKLIPRGFFDRNPALDVPVAPNK